MTVLLIIGEKFQRLASKGKQFLALGLLHIYCTMQQVWTRLGDFVTFNFSLATIYNVTILWELYFLHRTK